MTRFVRRVSEFLRPAPLSCYQQLSWRKAT